MKEKNKTILYYIFFILGVFIIFSAIIELLLFAGSSQAVSGFLWGIIFLIIAEKVKKHQKIKKKSFCEKRGGSNA
ncbi:MAG: hypothetical protein U9Q27_03200 [Patescibacteria group bacterium]|nr:hypothetical protein [Patescibacteria group bacterium]